jgi:hypothetical protein
MEVKIMTGNHGKDFWKSVLMALSAAAIVCLALPSCGESGGEEGDGDADTEVRPDTLADPDAAEDPAIDQPGEDVPGEDVPPEAPGDPDAEADAPDAADGEEEVIGGCEDQVAAIASETGVVGSCSAVVRLDYESRDILGWQLFCGSYAAATEGSARSRAQADTGYGAAGTMLNPADPPDEYVFYEEPGDFGGAAAVSARTGLSVFGGSIIWLGTGDITYPSIWRPASEIGSDCPEWPASVTATGYDLSSYGDPIGSADLTAALDVIWSTALPEGMATSGYLFDAVVIVYPRTMGEFDPATAEWIVILNGGYLE